MTNQPTQTPQRSQTGIELAQAIGVWPATRRYRPTALSGDEPRERYAYVLLALSRLDLYPGVAGRPVLVAYALHKSMSSGRMPATSKVRIADYTPYQLCQLVARISRDCPETTVGGICDRWLAQHHAEL